MKYNTISKADLKISAIGLGTWVIGGSMWGGNDEASGIEAVKTALDLGINLIDTAPIYGWGQAEEIVGQAIAGRRSEVIIASKCGLIKKGRDIGHDLSAESIRQEAEASLKRLRTDYIDLYQCHWPDTETPIEESMGCLNRLRDEGKIRHIGVSNFPLKLIQASAEIANVVTLQSEYSLLQRSLEKEIFPYCRKQDVGLLAYGCLGGGIMTGKYDQPKDFKAADARNFFYQFYQGQSFKKVHEFVRMLQSWDRPVGQIAINWVRQQVGVASALVGCRHRKQVRENINALDWDLDQDQLDTLQTVSAQLWSA